MVVFGLAELPKLNRLEVGAGPDDEGADVVVVSVEVVAGLSWGFPRENSEGAVVDGAEAAELEG